MGVVNHPAVRWKDNAAGHNQSRSFLECIDDCLTQVMKESMDRGALLDLVNMKGEVEIGRSGLQWL